MAASSGKTASMDSRRSRSSAGRPHRGPRASAMERRPACDGSLLASSLKGMVVLRSARAVTSPTFARTMTMRQYSAHR
ncbi:hypothetical protein PUN28_018360 [Cardiocondyla obscurior]|uniref:Uncharacterized protein n=1 Tax=Cardiocondyla obscurior TaxID=286306 RepID=A0AAW2EMW2_9HYME